MKLFEKGNAIENDNEFKEMPEKLMASAIKALKDGHRIWPQLYFFAEDGEVYGLPMALADEQDKLRARAEAVLWAKQLKAKKLIWLGDVFENNIKGESSGAFNGKGGICIVCQDGNDTFGIFQEYRRKRKGKRIKMGKRRKIERAEGFFTGILPD